MCLSPGAERRGGARARHEILLGIVDHAVALQTQSPATNKLHCNSTTIYLILLFAQMSEQKSSKLVFSCHN